MNRETQNGKMSAEELDFALSVADSHDTETADRLRAHIAAIQREADGLRQWKAEALAVEAEWDPQAVAAALGLKLGDSIRARILPAILQLQREAEEMREALQTIAIGYVVAGGIIRDAAGGVMDYVEPEEKPLRAEVAQSIARAALSQARGEPSLSSEGK